MATPDAALVLTGEDTTKISGATSDSYTPKAAERGMYLKAMATYTDRTREEILVVGADDTAAVGFENTATSDATTAVRNNPDNQAPEFD